ncbi:ribonuclease II, chloroplastic/mitochondrial isoform X2 [Gossypium australe]|uniref:Ribonuclease II, chloroplastic/mitochondrial isoform X2 n=1 Tax=Gossypium australe TaxID=47621 RepID=A0A5B6UB30_9ROSI|nr:ribonuclease II, chloroplastic/mitochondrial isoform X2 [Gossypium australe]
MLTYESATELLHLNLEEEAELKILSEAAALRLKWRRQQGAIDTSTLEARIKVVNQEDLEPSINLYVENQADPAMRLVSEMMILCGEVVATFGSCNNIPLPYRGQPQSNIDVSAYSHLPEGPVRSSAIVRIMRAAEIDFRKPIRHGVLGLPGYVQFTSPIRRYLDLLAHYQVGLQASAWVSIGSQVGDEVEVQVEEAHPRDDVLYLKETFPLEAVDAPKLAYLPKANSLGEN